MKNVIHRQSSNTVITKDQQELLFQFNLSITNVGAENKLRHQL